ncbi:hypothetical protein BCR35DRAFT_304060 [Leucosporidium creatinivorum]|uniref:Uncharacterized protein n=1 Tax=Leucosporidium creatinivorum TaxID=106004 RepID=A0A1Y2FCS6_9BASI|nr:hypothetical protein BCR35DRAFT_304060 [Leucosporidium creatinivorum]
MRLRSAGPPLSLPSALAPSLADPSTATLIPRLPLELLALIVQEAIISLVEKRRRKRAAELCLISKSLLPFAQDAFYFNIMLRGRSRAAEPSTSCPGDKLLDALERAPHLARRVFVISTPEHRYYGSPSTKLHLQRARLVCPNVNTLMSAGIRGWPILIHEILELVKDFRRVQLGMISSRGVQYVDLLPFAEMSQLEELVVLQCSLTEPLPPPPRLHLTSFSFEDTRQAPLPLPKLLDHFLSYSTTSLRHLGLPGHLPLPSLNRFISLTSLDIVFGPYGGKAMHGVQLPTPPLPTSDMLDSVLAACMSCPLLRRLQLSACVHSAQLVTLIEETSFLNRLPPSLELLDISLLPLALPSLLAYLAEAASPSLRRLNVHPLEDSEEQEMLQKTCWARGVEIYSERRSGRWWW